MGAEPVSKKVMGNLGAFPGGAGGDRGRKAGGKRTEGWLGSSSLARPSGRPAAAITVHAPATMALVGGGGAAGSAVGPCEVLIGETVVGAR